MMAIQRLSSTPHDAVRLSGSGVVLVPVAPVDISGGVVPCQFAAAIRIAIALNLSVTAFVTVTDVSPPLAIRYATNTRPVLLPAIAASFISTHGLGTVAEPAAPSVKWKIIIKSPAAIEAGNVTESVRLLDARDDVVELVIVGNDII